MKFYLKLLLFTFFLGLMFSSCNQKTARSSQLAEGQTSTFPESWLGKWKGELHIYKGTTKVQSIPMEMKIKSDASGNLNWNTIYKDKKSTEKPYTLIPVDKEKGFYLLDENNSIKIETYLFDNKLVSWYEVQGSMILASYEYREDSLIFEILAGKSDPVSISGGETIEEVDIPEVKTWPFTVMQRAVLRRK